MESWCYVGYDTALGFKSCRSGIYKLHRLLKLEVLESRIVFDGSWHNSELPCDVDRSGTVSPIDALIIIKDLNSQGARSLAGSVGDQFMLDTNGDQLLTPMDVLLIINLINRFHEPMQFSGDASLTDSDRNGVVIQSQIALAGKTVPESVVSILIDGGDRREVLSDVAGNFQIQLPLSFGSNLIEASAKDLRGRESEPFRLIVNRGDIVHDWNASILNVVRAWTALSNDPYAGRIVTSQPPLVARNLAMIHTAMFDAINAFSGQFASYLQDIPTVSTGASQEAAVAGAAFTVASALYPEPDELAIWNATLAESLASIVDAAARELGLAFGTAVGNAMLAGRVADGSASDTTYVQGEEPGDWQRTYPDYLPPLLPNWPNVTPFGVSSIEVYRPSAPPLLSSEDYALAVDEVMRIGAVNSPTRTPDQIEIALYWADGGGTATPPGHWNRIAADASMTGDRSLLENSRLFALLNIAMADAGIAAWDAKYAFDLWRPIDAIRQADIDGNLATMPDSTWLPLIETPPFPTYVSGHSTFSGAAAAVLGALLGENFNFESTNDPRYATSLQSLPQEEVVSRSFTSFWQAAEEAGVSRVYGGIHFSFDNAAGLEVGKHIGEDVVANVASRISAIVA